MKQSQPAFVEGIARAFYVSAWADREEERGRSHSGQELMDVAPATPRRAICDAWRFVGHLEAANRLPWQSIVAQASGQAGEDFEERIFGHYLGMQALGHGVAWTDDHEAVRLSQGIGEPAEMIVPGWEFNL